jgi:hypothetical protein
LTSLARDPYDDRTLTSLARPVVRIPYVSGALLAVALVLAPGSAHALNLDEWAPGFKLTPFAAERLEYESNIFQAPSHARDDFISRTSPGLSLGYAGGPLEVEATYRAEILRFFELTGQDAEHHIASGRVQLQFPRLRLRLLEDYTKTTDPPGSELTGRIESRTNVLAPEAEYRITPRLAVGTNYTWTRFDFPTIPELDRDEHLVGASLFWRVVPRADIRLNYNYGVKEFDTASDRDATRHVILLGLRGEVTAKLSSTFRIGYEVRQAQHAGGLDGQSWVVGGDTIFRPGSRTTITLSTQRSFDESTFGSGGFYVTSVATLLAEHRITPKITAELRLTGGENTYPTKETVDGQTKFRDDLLYGWGLGARYDIERWLRLELQYLHTGRDSNFRSFRFEDDRVSTTVTVHF